MNSCNKICEDLKKCHWVKKLCLAPDRIWRKQYGSKTGLSHRGFDWVVFVFYCYTLMMEGLALVSDFTFPSISITRNSQWTEYLA